MLSKPKLYRIYYGSDVVYVGRTNQTLQARLRGHVFGKPMHRKIDIERLTKVEYTTFDSVADMYLYEVYYINLLKPVLNKDDKARDALNIVLPEKEWMEFTTPLFEKWRTAVRLNSECAERDIFF